MMHLRLLLGERRIHASPVGLHLVDDFAGGPPLGKVEATIDLWHSAQWHRLDTRPILTLSGRLAYPGLGRHPFPVNGQPRRRFRIQLKLEYYDVLYPPGMDGFEFDAPAFNDAYPPPTPTLHTAYLLPAPTYPFSSSTYVLWGKVIDGVTKERVVGAVVYDDGRQKVLTDKHGEFALPLRWPKPGLPFPIDAYAGNKTGVIVVKFPADLATFQSIELT